VLRAAALVENLGIPTASIVGSGFLKRAEVVAKGLGLPLALGRVSGRTHGGQRSGGQALVESRLRGTPRD
jgi:hypothetical protein